jgi:hypothetical protein
MRSDAGAASKLKHTSAWILEQGAGAPRRGELKKTMNGLFQQTVSSLPSGKAVEPR